MQVTETLTEGLRREFRVLLTASDLETRLVDGLAGLKDKVKINGFRPGKVPAAHMRKMYGRSVMNDVLQNAVNEANSKISADKAVRFAMEPKVRFPESKEEIEAALDAKGDLAFTVAVEVLPKIEMADHSGIALTKLVAEAPDADVEAALERMAGQNRSFTSRGEMAEAADGDKLIIDFTGSIDGVKFDGGTGEGIELVLGSNSFIPGFEPQMVGAKTGESRAVTVSFPENYQAEHLAGKAAVFEVTATDIQAPDPVKVDEALAKAFGMDSLEALREAVKAQLQREMDAQSRRRLKKVLLDALDTQYAFELPPTLVDQEFTNVWAQVENDMKEASKTFADEGTTEEAARVDYLRIAERRVRLGLVLAEIGDGAKIQIADEEVTQALIERARQYPGQEKQVWEFYRKNPQALAELRAPIFEEKVVDHLLGLMTINEQTVSREALFSDDDAPVTDAADGDNQAKPVAKNAVAKPKNKAE